MPGVRNERTLHAQIFHFTDDTTQALVLIEESTLPLAKRSVRWEVFRCV